MWLEDANGIDNLQQHLELIPNAREGNQDTLNPRLDPSWSIGAEHMALQHPVACTDHRLSAGKTGQYQHFNKHTNMPTRCWSQECNPLSN